MLLTEWDAPAFRSALPGWLREIAPERTGLEAQTEDQMLSIDVAPQGPASKAKGVEFGV